MIKLISSIIFKYLLLVVSISLLTGCGSSEQENTDATEGVPPVGDISGSWQVTVTGSSLTPDCDGDSFILTANIIQSGSNLTASGDDGTSLSGTIAGNQISMLGSYPEDGGTTTVSSLTATATSDCNQFSGNESRTWSNGLFSCS